MPEKIPYLPEQNGYGITDGVEVLSVQLAGGLGRYRKDKVGAAAIGTFTWLLDPTQYTAFRVFYDTTINKGADAFLVDLVYTESTLREYTARIIPGTFRLAQVEGHSYRISAQVEIQPDPTPTELIGESVYLPPGDADYFLWDMEASADVAASTSSNIGAFYPQSSNNSWTLGTPNNAGDSTEWAFSSGAWQWEKTAPKGLKCLATAKTGFRFRYDNSNTTALLPELWPEDRFFYVEFYVNDYDRGGPSNNQNSIIFAAPYTSGAKNMKFGINLSKELQFEYNDGTNSGTVTTNGVYTLTTPFTGHLGFAINPATNLIHFFVDGAEVHNATIPSYADNLVSTAYTARAHLGINVGGTQDQPPEGAILRQFNLYRIPSGSLIVGWATTLVENNYIYYSTQLGI